MSGATNPQLDDAEAKLKHLDLQIERDPTNALWHWRRGVALALAVNFTGARESLEKAIALLPRYADAWAALGEVHAKIGDRKSAKRAFRAAIDIDPLTKGALARYRAHASAPEVLAWDVKTAVREYRRKGRRHAHCPDAHQTLQEAISLGDRGHIPAAIDVLRRGLSCCPGYLPFAKYLGAYLVMHGNKQQSRHLMETMVALWPEDAQAHFAHGVCLTAIGDKAGSVAALERALALSPDSHDIRVALAVAGKGAPPAPDLVLTRNVFDSYAERFDAHLVEGLNYRVPEKLAAILAASGRTWDRMLDLGCGTGLSGANLRPYARHLTGVDLSLQMIEKAKARGVYDTMYQGDCVAFLQQIEGTYDLMVAADVLVYFGDLTNLFRAARQRLAPGAAFWFSVEECGGDGFSITLSQRYQHSLSYIRTTAQAVGLRLTYEQQIDIRLENRKPVRGLLVAIERPDDISGNSSWQFKPAPTPE